jgi:hypothetical protein
LGAVGVGIMLVFLFPQLLAFIAYMCVEEYTGKEARSVLEKGKGGNKEHACDVESRPHTRWHCGSHVQLAVTVPRSLLLSLASRICVRRVDVVRPLLCACRAHQCRQSEHTGAEEGSHGCRSYIVAMVWCGIWTLLVRGGKSLEPRYRIVTEFEAMGTLRY